jgi:hypothetical protein
VHHAITEQQADRYARHGLIWIPAPQDGVRTLDLEELLELSGMAIKPRAWRTRYWGALLSTDTKNDIGHSYYGLTGTHLLVGSGQAVDVRQHNLTHMLLAGESGPIQDYAMNSDAIVTWARPQQHGLGPSPQYPHMPFVGAVYKE